jgi:hypothetical protein
MNAELPSTRTGKRDGKPGAPPLSVAGLIGGRCQGVLDPFLAGGAGCARLVTTRTELALPAGCPSIRVDAMTGTEAKALLTRDLAGVPSDELIGQLADRTGRWPVLLGLVGRALYTRCQRGCFPCTGRRSVSSPAGCSTRSRARTSRRVPRARGGGQRPRRRSRHRVAHRGRAARGPAGVTPPFGIGSESVEPRSWGLRTPL